MLLRICEPAAPSAVAARAGLAGEFLAARERCVPGHHQSQLHYVSEVPERTDDGEEAMPFLQVTERYAEPEGPRMSRAEMLDFLFAQHGAVCQGCDRRFDDPGYLQLDHNTHRSEGGLNDITNRILLCGPCNRLKSNQYTLSGLRRQGVYGGMRKQMRDSWGHTKLFCKHHPGKYPSILMQNLDPGITATPQYDEDEERELRSLGVAVMSGGGFPRVPIDSPGKLIALTGNKVLRLASPCRAQCDIAAVIKSIFEGTDWTEEAAFDVILADGQRRVLTMTRK